MAKPPRKRVDDKELEKLCHGCIVYADFYNSFEKNAAGPHYAIVLDSDQMIRTKAQFRVVVISTKDRIDPDFLMAVPAYTGLEGFIVGSWTTTLDEAGIQRVKGKLKSPEMVVVINLVREADAAKAARDARKRRGPSREF